MRKRDGFCQIFMKTNGSYLVRIDQYDSVLAAFEGSGIFVRAVGLYGDDLTILRASIEGVGRSTSEAYEAALADEQQMKRDEAIEG